MEGGSDVYRLAPRVLSEADGVWVERFTAGDDYWEMEVVEHLRVDALRQQQGGYNRTTLFSYPGNPEIVGFMTLAPTEVRWKDLQQQVPVGDPVLRKLPVVLVVYLGVARRFQGNGHGLEMHTRLLEDLANSMSAPRFIYLQCWADNQRALGFYNKIGYVQFDDVEEARPDGLGKAHLLKLVYDRFKIPDQ